MSASRVLLIGILCALGSGCGGSDDNVAPQNATGGGGSGGTSTGGSGGSGGSAGSSGSAGAGGTAGSGTGGFSGYYVELTLPAPSTSPVDAPGVTFYSDIAYGPDPKMKLDYFQPAEAATEAVPLIVFIHGGGFTGGDKGSGYDSGDQAGVKQVLAAGVAYASINYRLLEEVDSEGVIKPLGDSRRALQFLRHHAAELGFDPTRVGLRGGSAGAGTNLWLGFHDDMKDASSSDPVAQQSTRVTAVVANATQATYDLVKWSTVVFAEYGLDLMTSVQALGMEQRLASFYGLSSTVDLEAQLETAPIVAYRADVDMLGLMSADDPPFYVHNTLPETIPTDQGVLFHHPYHARALRERATEVGADCTAKIEALDVDDAPGKTDFDFLLEAL